MTGKELKQIMADLGMKQKDLAKLCNVSQNTVSRWMNRIYVPGPAAAFVNKLRGEGKS